MRFEHYLRIPQETLVTLPAPTQRPPILWNFFRFEALKYEGEGPFMFYTLPIQKTLQSKQPLYTYRHNDLSVFGCHKEVHLLSEDHHRLRSWYFDVQEKDVLEIKEDPIGVYQPGQTKMPPFWPYGGYYKPGCSLEEIEPVWMTIQYTQGEVVPFFIRESEKKMYAPN